MTLAMAVIVLFWFLDSTNKIFRENYKKRRTEITKVLNSYFKTGQIPANFISPSFPKHMYRKTIRLFMKPYIFIFRSLLSLPAQ